MNTNHLTALLQDDIVTVGVVFLNGSREYTYKCHRNLAVAEGDTVVVDSPRDGLVCVKVTRVDNYCDIDIESSITYKHVVCRVDTSHYEDILEREKEFENNLRAMQRRRKINEALKAAVGDFGDDQFDSMVKSLRGCNVVGESQPSDRYLSSIGASINEKV